MSPRRDLPPIEIAVRKWGKHRGSLIMMLHEIQNQHGYVPRDQALELGHRVGVPVARIYEVLTFYNYFKLESPGKAVISVCTGTACHLAGAPELTAAISEELGIGDGESTADGYFHLQTVRCIGACSLAPVAVIKHETYGKLRPERVPSMIAEWRERLDKEEHHD